MRTALRLALENPLVRFDPDTRAYITAVESADGQALEPGVRTALDAFVRGCKSDGIWDAIKASCIMAGARTLEGALVPLKGTAPTNFNFVSGDYNRKTGLVGDGSTKYLDSNRNNNADPQNNFHISVHVTNIGSSINGALLGGLNSVATDPGSVSLLGNTTTNLVFARAKSALGIQTTISYVPGLVGMSRSVSTSYLVRGGSINETISTTTDGNIAANLAVFRRQAESPLYSNARLSYYSIGSALDLAKLDARVTQLMARFAEVIV